MVDERSTEVVPGMAEKVEWRRRQLRLSPSDFAQAAGVTTQALQAVRKGYRRNYQEKVRFGVARALLWQDDAIDRLLIGLDPVPVEPDPDGPEAVIAAELGDDLTDDEWAKVRAFIAGLKAARE